MRSPANALSAKLGFRPVEIQNGKGQPMHREGALQSSNSARNKEGRKERCKPAIQHNASPQTKFFISTLLDELMRGEVSQRAAMMPLFA
jgi:hypothetical protein